MLQNGAQTIFFVAVLLPEHNQENHRLSSRAADSSESEPAGKWAHDIAMANRFFGAEPHGRIRRD